MISVHREANDKLSNGLQPYYSSSTTMLWAKWTLEKNINMMFNRNIYHVYLLVILLINKEQLRVMGRSLVMEVFDQKWKHLQIIPRGAWLKFHVKPYNTDKI